ARVGSVVEHPQIPLWWRQGDGVPVDQAQAVLSSDQVASMRLAVGDHELSVGDLAGEPVVPLEGCCDEIAVRREPFSSALRVGTAVPLTVDISHCVVEVGPAWDVETSPRSHVPHDGCRVMQLCPQLAQLQPVAPAELFAEDPNSARDVWK